MWVGLVLIVGSGVAYNFKDALLKFVMAPLHGQKLIYLTPAGGFSFIFQIAIYAGLLAAIPVLIYHIHAFIKPALPIRARKSATKVVLAATVLVLGGVAYGYYIAIPHALDFLTTFAGDTVNPSLTADSYLSFFLAYVAGIAALSLLPLLLLFVHWIRPLTPGNLLKSERWVILFAFIVAAFITPPDAVNQTMLAVPIILVYQLGVAAVLMSVFKARKADRVAAHESLRSQATAQEPTVQPIERTLAAPQIIATQTTSQAARLATRPATVRVPARTLDGFTMPRPAARRVTPNKARFSLDGILIQ